MSYYSYSDSLQRMHNTEENPLSEIFFSEKNVNEIQKRIIKEVNVFFNNKIEIGKQDETHLFSIMREIFDSTVQTSQDAQHIQDMNRLTVLKCVQIIITQVQQYISYTQHMQDHYNTFSTRSDGRTNRQVLDYSQSSTPLGGRGMMR